MESRMLISQSEKTDRQTEKEGGRKGGREQTETNKQKEKIHSLKLKQFTCVARELLALTQKGDWLYLRHPICQVPNSHNRGQDHQSLTSTQDGCFKSVVPQTSNMS